MKSIQQIASSMYEAYCLSTGRTSADNTPVPPYADLGGAQKAGWQAAARCARDEIQKCH